ncbi:hypothetical protein BpHYR1_020033 [Brachionus plicatilis]|uniref:Uncharacterized protein n=1 Tax=Brachionus plicatilis TaxID=10195 RepID=A0A3M7RQ76_BRAPC|nr:hypothetical protein BpHYR1_020033 [Brachionus plicatilis]
MCYNIKNTYSRPSEASHIRIIHFDSYSKDSGQLDNYEDSSLFVKQIHNLSFHESFSSDIETPESSEYENDEESSRRKRTSKCWEFFHIKKFKKNFIGTSNKNGRLLPNRIVKCMISHNDN